MHSLSRIASRLPLLLAVSAPLSLISLRASADEAPPQASQAPQQASASAAEKEALFYHRGFFFRFESGVGYLTASEPVSADTSTGSVAGQKVTISGPAGFAGVALGGAIADNVILAAHVYDMVAIHPSVSYGGQSGSSSATLTGFGFGPELDIYLMPSNVYFSFTGALTTLSVSYDGESADASLGFGGRVGLGKEWFLGKQWGLGLAAGVSLASNKDTNDATLTTWTVGLSFTATYNQFFSEHDDAEKATDAPAAPQE